MKWLQKLFLVTVFLIFIVTLTLAADDNLIGECYDTPFCVDNDTFGISVPYMYDGDLFYFNFTVNTTGKGNFLFTANANSTSNATEVKSTAYTVNVYEKGVLNLCTENKTGDIFCINESSLAQSAAMGIDNNILYFNYTVITMKDAPVPSNWTFYAFSNSSSNITTVLSPSYTVSVLESLYINISVSIISPINTTYNNENVSINIKNEGEDLDTCFYNINGGENITYQCNQSQFSLILPDGSYVLNAFVNDTFGNEKSDSVAFTVRSRTAFYAAYTRVNDFTFASNTFVEGTRFSFNISGVPSANLIFMGSGNLVKLSVPGQKNTIWARIKVDGDIKSTQKLRYIDTINEEGSVSFKPVAFTVSSGEHVLTIEYMRENNGIININDIDLSIGELDTVDGGIVTGTLNSTQVDYSNNVYQSIFDFSINSPSPGKTYIASVHTDSSVSEGNVSYYLKNKDTGQSSPESIRYLSGSADLGSLSTLFLDSHDGGVINYSIMASQTDTTVTSNFSVLYFNLNNNNSRTINSNSSTNLSSTIDTPLELTSGTHRLASVSGDYLTKVGNQSFVSFTASFGSKSGSFTPTFFINSSNLSETDCYSKKERYISSNSDVGNVMIFVLCDNEQPGVNYTYNAYVTVPSGETLLVYDENLVVLETVTKNIATKNLPPVANDFIQPANGTNVTGTGNITWYDWSDPEGSYVNYSFYVYQNNVIIDTLFTDTQNINTTEVNFLDYPEGETVFNLIGCDNLSYCSSRNLTLFVTSAKPNVTIYSPENVTYDYHEILFNVSSTSIALDSCWYNIHNGSGNISYTCNTTFNLTLSEGSYFFEAFANATTSEEDSANVSFSINTPPLLNLTEPGNDTYIPSKNVNFSWIVIDSSNASFACDFYLDSVINSTQSCLNDTICKTNVTNLAEGRHTWKVTCSDGYYTSEKSRVFTIDTITPLINLTNPFNKTYTINNLTVNATSNELLNCYYSNGSSNVSMPVVFYKENITIDSLNDSSKSKELSFNGLNNKTVYIDLHNNITHAYLNISGLEQKNDTSVSHYVFGNSSEDFSPYFDEDWETYVDVPFGVPGQFEKIYMNYTIPANANATRVLKYYNDNSDGSLEEQCLNSSNAWQTFFYIDSSTGNIVTIKDQIPYDCINNSEVLQIRQTILRLYSGAGISLTRLYEHSIEWGNVSLYPTNVTLEIGTPDSSPEWSYNGTFNITQTTSDLKDKMNEVASNCNCDGCTQSGDTCTVPLTFYSDSKGIVKIESINISYFFSEYRYGANYNATEGSNTITVSCNDSAGNLNHSSVTFFVDSIYPIWFNKTEVPKYEPQGWQAFSFGYQPVAHAAVDYNFGTGIACKEKYYPDFCNETEPGAEFNYISLLFNFTNLTGVPDTLEVYYNSTGNPLNYLIFYILNDTDVRYSDNWIIFGCSDSTGPTKGRNGTGPIEKCTVKLPNRTVRNPYNDYLYILTHLNTTLIELAMDGTFNVTGYLYYNPAQTYEFNITYYDSAINNVTFNLSSDIKTLNAPPGTTTFPVNVTYNTLGAGVYWFNWKGCDELGNCNITNYYKYEIKKSYTETYLYINGNRSNASIIYGDNLNITAYTTNATVDLYVNGTLETNPFNNTLAPGLYNITAINEGNNNYTGSKETFWLMVNGTAPLWSNNYTIPDSGTVYNPKQSYIFGINFSSVANLSNVTLKIDDIVRTINLSNGTKEGTFEFNVTTLGAGNHTYNFTGCDVFSFCNTTDTWVYKIIKSNTTVYLYLNDNESNLTINYSDFLNITAYTTNVSVTLYLNNVTVSNPYNETLKVGVYNVTGINEGNNNYTGSSKTFWLTIEKFAPYVYLFINDNRSDFESRGRTLINLTAYTNSEVPAVIFVNGTSTNNPNISNWTTPGYYNVTAIVNESENMTFAYETWYINLTKQFAWVRVFFNDHEVDNVAYIKTGKYYNITMYLLDLFDNTTINELFYYYNNFYGPWGIIQEGIGYITNISNLTFNENKQIGAVFNRTDVYYPVSKNITVIPYFTDLNVSYSLDITNFSYSCRTINTSDQKDIEPCGQNDTIGIFNLTLNSTFDSVLVKVNISESYYGINMYLTDHYTTNYTTEGVLLNETSKPFFVLNNHESNMVWHYMDFVNPFPGTVINYTLTFDTYNASAM